MATRVELIAAVRERYRAVDELAGGLAAVALSPELEELIQELLDELGSALGPEILNDTELRRLAANELREDILRQAFGQALDRTETMDRAQDLRNQQFEDTDAIGFVYLGPDDASNRPFCNALERHWFTRDQISRLDNGQIPDVWTSRGGYNCRHGWYALFEGDEEGWDQATDAVIAQANAAARG